MLRHLYMFSSTLEQESNNNSNDNSNSDEEEYECPKVDCEQVSIFKDQNLLQYFALFILETGTCT